MKVIFDTNIFVSAILVKVGIPAQILKRNREFNLFLSSEIIEEIKEVLNCRRIRRKFSLMNSEILIYLFGLEQIAQKIKVKKKVRVVKNDPDDDKFLALAAQVKADYIISGDAHLLKLKKFRKTVILPPAEFLKILFH